MSPYVYCMVEDFFTFFLPEDRLKLGGLHVHVQYRVEYSTRRAFLVSKMNERLTGGSVVLHMY